VVKENTTLINTIRLLMVLFGVVFDKWMRQ